MLCLLFKCMNYCLIELHVEYLQMLGVNHWNLATGGTCARAYAWLLCVGEFFSSSSSPALVLETMTSVIGTHGSVGRRENLHVYRWGVSGRHGLGILE